MSKKIIIVGGSSGLGKRLAELYASEGNEVGIIARREELLAKLSESFPDKIIVKSADISDNNIQQVIIDLITSLKGIDILIVAASIIHFNNELSIEKETATIEINVKGYTQVLLTAWNYFEKKGHGQIVGITSIAAARGNKTSPAYHSSKAFQSIYLESLRVKAKSVKNNISITELIPGYIDTDMGKGDRMFWVASLNKAADYCKRAIERKKAKAFITSRWWFVYHIQRLLPIFIYDAVVNGSWKLKRKQ